MNLCRNINWCKAVILLILAMLAWPVSCDRPATMVLIRTDLGDMTVEIYEDQAPVTAANFLSHVERGDYTYRWGHLHGSHGAG